MVRDSLPWGSTGRHLYPPQRWRFFVYHLEAGNLDRGAVNVMVNSHYSKVKWRKNSRRNQIRLGFISNIRQLSFKSFIISFDDEIKSKVKKWILFSGNHLFVDAQKRFRVADFLLFELNPRDYVACLWSLNVFVAHYMNSPCRVAADMADRAASSTLDIDFISMISLK